MKNAINTLNGFELNGKRIKVSPGDAKPIRAKTVDEIGETKCASPAIKPGNFSYITTCQRYEISRRGRLDGEQALK